jgi:hypothetical protein
MAQLRKDPAFSPIELDDLPTEPGAANTYIATLLPTFDGRVLVKVHRDNSTCAFFMLTASGAIDGSFSPIILGENSDVFPLGDGSLLGVDAPSVGDHFARRYFADGTVDAGFAPYLLGASGTTGVTGAVQRSDGKILLCGAFPISAQDRWEGGLEDTPQFVLLDLDGQESAGFTAATLGSTYSGVNALAALPDGRVAISGDLHIRVQGDNDPQSFVGIAGEVSAIGELEQPYFENIDPFSSVVTDPSLPGLLLSVQGWSPGGSTVHLKAPGEPFVGNASAIDFGWPTVVRTDAGAAVLGSGDLTPEVVIPAQHIVAGEFVGPVEFLSVGDDWDESPLYPFAYASPAAGVLFVTDAQVVHRLLLIDDDGPPGGTRWVPLAESGIGHALYVESPFESSITLYGSTIVADNATYESLGIGWNLEVSVADVPEYFTGRVRVTTQIDYVDAPESGPLVLYYTAEGGANPSIINEHEDSTAFVPNPVVLGPLAPWSGHDYGLVQFAAWGIDVLSGTFYIEVEVQDDGPPSGECFWTDLLGVTEDCGEAPDPEVNWIPIHTSDMYYSLLSPSEGTYMVDSTIITDIGFGDPGWQLWLGQTDPPGGRVRVRVTVSITAVTPGESSQLVFQYTDGGGEFGVVPNEHPDSTAFEPSQFVVEIANNGDQNYLELLAFDTPGLTATYFIEVEGPPL